MNFAIITVIGFFMLILRSLLFQIDRGCFRRKWIFTCFGGEMEFKMRTCFINAALLTPFNKKDAIVMVDGGKISGIYNRLDFTPDMKVIDAGGLYLSPGFIDIHVHGGGGFGVMSCDADSIVKMCAAHAQYGTTSMVPTTLAAPIAVLFKAIDAVKAAQSKSTGCNILGVHLEGPFLSKNQKGAQSEDSILVPSLCDYRGLLDYWDGIKIMGAAPEIDGAMELGRELHRRNILGSVAHSDATYDEMNEALENGYRDITHIYSGCSSVIRRNGYRVAGVVETGLLRDEFSVQVIADLKHLPAALLKLIYKCKGAERISLVTDGLEYAASAIEEGTVYRQDNGIETIYEDGVMKLMDRQAFAGSVATCNRLVRNMVLFAGVPLLEAVQMATTTPASKIGESARKGVIAAGYDADLILFDGNIDVKMCMVGGKLIFNHVK
jgi:N-acetylglucosamine-6-phosphate deacetylase